MLNKLKSILPEKDKPKWNQIKQDTILATTKPSQK
jgi:hypothetical protein